jgi:glycosyltransferase involved in cell wall biosynthesis
MNEQPKLVSVIIPVYNGERFIAESIESALEQSYSPIEIILVDDGSTDGSLQIARSYDNIQILKQAHQGVSSARNAGIAAARGSFLAFLDSDDIWDREKISKQIHDLQRHTDIGCVFCRFENFFDPETSPPDWLNRSSFLDKRFKDMMSLCTMLIRKEIFDRVGNFNTDLRSGEDLDWFVRAKEAGIVSKHMDEILVSRRLHDKNLTYSNHSTKADLLRVFKASIDRKNLKEGK